MARMTPPHPALPHFTLSTLVMIDLGEPVNPYGRKLH
jgi:hypothetical protein